MSALTWGIKRSFIEYVRMLDDGELAATDGAVVDATGTYGFPLASAEDFDAAAGSGIVRFSGRADVVGHHGMMSLTVETPWIEIDEDGARLTIPDPDRDPGHRVTIATLELPAGTLAPDHTGLVTVTAAPAALAMEAIGLFNHQYAPGTDLDTVGFSFQVPQTSRREASDPNVRLSLVVAERIEEAEGIVSLSLVDPTGAALPPWSPGSHIDVHAADGLVRQYSLSSRTSDRERWRVTVLREDAGAASTLLHDRIEVGASVEVSLPRNNFVLVPAERYVFVAGGIGITPIVPMIEAAEASGAEWTLVYSGRQRGRMAFVEELAVHGDRARVVATAEEPRVDFREYFAVPQPGTLVYACGPEGLLVELEAATAGWPADSLHVERFVPREFDESGDVEFEVEFADSGLTVTIPVDRTILAVAEEHDIPVISSCSEGTCGTCETVVLNGLPEHRDSILTDAERLANRTMFICVSRSVGGGKLTLEL